MKIRFKANLELDFKVNNKKSSHGKCKMWYKEVIKWLLLTTTNYLFENFILKRLVALIINIITNGSFYFYNRMFYFEVDYV